MRDLRHRCDFLQCGKLEVDPFLAELLKKEGQLVYQLLKLLFDEIFVDEFKQSIPLANGNKTAKALTLYSALKLFQFFVKEHGQLTETLFRIAVLIGRSVRVYILLEAVQNDLDALFVDEFLLQFLVDQVLNNAFKDVLVERCHYCFQEDFLVGFGVQAQPLILLRQLYLRNTQTLVNNDILADLKRMNDHLLEDDVEDFVFCLRIAFNLQIKEVFL